MTEISKSIEKTRYSVNPTAFVLALVCAPLFITLMSFWTVIGLFALPFGVLPYLIIGTPILLWAVGRIKPRFGAYALLGFAGNLILGVFMLISATDFEVIRLFFLFGAVFAPLYAGAFGHLYAGFHPNIRILRT
ncbi:hypothetical protein [Yoonia sp. BS5-3]|uniref:Apolipoprotein N-acyltransferase n=1 Tax=Yoonia phaeophyticola TaxID=3137369 RepID=A0ABZ2V6F6_9RHOB